MPYLNEDRSSSLLMALDRIFMLKTMKEFNYPVKNSYYHINNNLMGQYFWMDELSVDEFTVHLGTVIEKYDIEFYNIDEKMDEYLEEANITCVMRFNFLEEMIDDLHVRDQEEVLGLLSKMEQRIMASSDTTCEFGTEESDYHKDPYTMLVFQDMTYTNHSLYGKALRAFINIFHELIELYKQKYGHYPLAKEENDAVSG
jgi:hypothetical protein